MTALFIDVSYHDWNRRGGALDWAAIARAGMGRVMCARASYGDPGGFNPASPRFAEFMTGARAAGFDCRGGYHNLIRGDQASINRQVDLLRSTMDRHGTEWAMADVEAYQELVDRGLVPRWEDVQRFHDRWYAVEPDRVMAWYIARWVWEGKLGAPNLAGLRGPLINANYRGGDGTAQQIYANAGTPGWAEYVTAPKGGPVKRAGRAPDVWQFTSTGNVPGASDNTDVNAYPGTVDQLVALLTGNTPSTMRGDDEMYLVNVLVGDADPAVKPKNFNYIGTVGAWHYISGSDPTNATEALAWVQAQGIKDLGSMWDWQAKDRLGLDLGVQAPEVDPAALAAAVAAEIRPMLPADTLSVEKMEQVIRRVLAPGFVLAPDATP